jgi:SAM-dependent methyltransferase
MSIYDRINKDKTDIKQSVKAHWEQEPCELRAGKSKADHRRFFEEIDAFRYAVSPFVMGFAKFADGSGKKVLEVGLGSGSDFMRWARGGAELYGIDLTEASVALIRDRVAMEEKTADVRVGDAEALPFSNDFFDIVYSCGVIHHTPDTEKAAQELYRVCAPGGIIRIMIYHLGGLTWFYQYILFGLLKGKPFRSRREIAFYHNESLGTKLYTKSEARKLFPPSAVVTTTTIVDAGDTLNFPLSERYKNNLLLKIAFRIFFFLKYLRPLIPSFFGTSMLIEVEKPREHP